MMYGTGAEVLRQVGLTEIVVVLAIVGVLVWLLPKSLPTLMRTFGRARGEFEKGKIAVERELEEERSK